MTLLFSDPGKDRSIPTTEKRMVFWPFWLYLRQYNYCFPQKYHIFGKIYAGPKVLRKFIIVLQKLLPISFKINNKFQNHNQVTNLDIIITSLKNKNFEPEYVVDVGCFRGIWTNRLLKYFPKSKYILFDADDKNIEYLDKLKSNNKND